MRWELCTLQPQTAGLRWGLRLQWGSGRPSGALCRWAGPLQGGAPSTHSRCPPLFHSGPTPHPRRPQLHPITHWPDIPGPRSPSSKRQMPPGTGIRGNVAGGSASQAMAVSVLEFSTSQMLLVLMQSGYSRKMTSHACQLVSLICVALKWWLTPDPWPMGRPWWPFGWFVTAPHNEEKLPGRPRNWAWELPYPTMPSPEQGCLPSRAWPKSRVMTPPVSQQGGASFHRVPASSVSWAASEQVRGSVTGCRGQEADHRSKGDSTTEEFAARSSRQSTRDVWQSLTVSTGPGLPGGKHAGQVSLVYLWTSGCPSDSRPLGALVAAACEALAERWAQGQKAASKVN